MHTAYSALPLEEASSKLQREYGSHPVPPAPKTGFLWRLTRPFLILAAAVSIVALTALAQLPRDLLRKPFLCNSPLSQTPKSDFQLPELEAFLLSELDATRNPEWSKYYTSTIHFAGQGKEQGVWTKDKWEEFGIPHTQVYKYNSRISRPLYQRLALLDVSDSGSPSVTFEAKLMEELPPSDPSKVLMPTFHAQSNSGNITAQFVYANLGLAEDYDLMEERGVDIAGKIVIVKAGVNFRAEKMWVAANRGAVGILTYTDPQHDGEITEQNGYKVYPDGPARPATAIERGAIGQVRNANAGNPSIPGLAIPSLPISYGEALPLLQALQGHGPRATDMASSWLGGGLYYKGVDYHVGPSPPHVVLNLNNQIAFPYQDTYQIFGIINGTLEDEVIMLGNHRDAWGPGAGDPGSGSAALMEVARAFGAAYKKGWRPLRTIIFVSWEGEEVGQIGGHSFIDSHMPWIQKSVVTYMNVVVGAGGPTFIAKASPLLQKVIHSVTRDVDSPAGGKVFDHWGGKLAAAGGGDAISFTQTACVATSDFSFGADYWPYHTNFDTYTWMETFGDPGWKYHVTTSKIWTLAVARLSENPVLQFAANDYAVAMQGFVEHIKTSLLQSSSFDISPLEDAIAAFQNASVSLDTYASSLGSRATHDTLRQVNKKYIDIERHFCYNSLHLIFDFAPFYIDPMEFPLLANSIAAGDLDKAQVSGIQLFSDDVSTNNPNSESYGSHLGPDFRRYQRHEVVEIGDERYRNNIELEPSDNRCL